MRSFAVLAILFFASRMAISDNNVYLTMGTVVLDGYIVRKIADPSITYDEKAHPYYALVLREPIDVRCSPDDDVCENENNVYEMHLALPEVYLNDISYFLNSRVQIHGSLYHSHTGYHFTSILIDVEKLNKI